MKLQPVVESQAESATKQAYLEIKEALGLPQVPLFFQYLGAFSDYLLFIKEPIINNLNSPKYQELVKENQNFVKETFFEHFPKKQLLSEFIKKYQYAPEFYNLKKELEHIFTVNAKLVFIFLALREAVKGWAVASKKLESHFQQQAQKKTENNFFTEQTKTEFIYSTDIIILNTKNTNYLKATSGNNIEVALLPKYLELCEAEFNQLVKSEAYLYFRVRLEKICLRSLEQLPYPVFSPINLVLKLTQKYPDFPELLYLLSEHFPTYAVSRYLFSGYML
jgi:hypothetical protein